MDEQIKSHCNRIDQENNERGLRYFFGPEETITNQIKNILDQGTFCRIYIISINKYWKLLKNKSTKIANSSPFELAIKNQP